MVIAAALVLAAPLASAHVIWMPEPPELPDPTRAGEPIAYADILDDWAGAEIGGALTLRGTAWAQPGFEAKFVTVWVDGQEVGVADGLEAWTFVLDTRRLIDGPHQVAAYAMAVPKAAPAASPWIGSGEKVLITTLNHVRGEPLYVATYDMTGAEADSWTLLLREDYASLRVLVETEEGPRAGLGPRGEVIVSYAAPADDSSWTPERAWLATFGATGAALVVSRETDVQLQEGGTIALASAFAGDGRVTIRVEALSVSAL